MNEQKTIFHFPRVLLAAPQSGSGKTLITCALLQALKNRHIDVCSFKCGPDYIDPMFHRTVLGIDSENLDSWFSGEDGIRQLFCEAASSHDFSVMEGVMGLYDGAGGTRQEGSSYHLAAITSTPVILIINVRGMARSMLPLIRGFLDYDTGHLIRGIILNRMTKSFYQTMQPLLLDTLNAYPGVKLLGYFPERKDLHLESRHLGLCMPGEISDIKSQLESAGKQLQESVDLEGLIEIADKASILRYIENPTRISEKTLEENTTECADKTPEKSNIEGADKTPEKSNTECADKTPEKSNTESADKTPEKSNIEGADKKMENSAPVIATPDISEESADTPGNDKYINGTGLTLAVARDEAFCFYYPANLRMFEKSGVRICYFSPLHDHGIPKEADGILLGGGYPENYAEQLSKNTSMLFSIRKAIGEGMPSLAECGGFMYLHSKLTTQEGISYPMAGVWNADCTWKGKLVRFGYVELQKKQLHETGEEKISDNKKDASCFIPLGTKIKAHEFHYFDSTDNGKSCMAVKTTGKTWDCIASGRNFFWGFPHLYYPSCPEFTIRFIKCMHEFKNR